MKRSLKQAITSLVAVAVLSTTSFATAAEKDIVDTAVAAGSFKTLAAALGAADLVSALKGNGPFTVFAPTDDAFAKLPKGTVAELLKPENKDKLTAILTYHVVAGRVPAAAVVKLKGAKTLNGQRVDIAVADGKVMLDKANVVKTDIECSNGIIHVIDSVILPSGANIVETASEAGKFNTLLAAAKAAGLAEASLGERPIHRLRTHRCRFCQTTCRHGRVPAEAGKQEQVGCDSQVPRSTRTSLFGRRPCGERS